MEPKEMMMDQVSVTSTALLSTTPDAKPKLWGALVKARAAVKNAVKNAQNPHLKNKYANLEAILDTCNQACHEHGLTFIQCPVQAPQGHVGLETIVGHESGETLRFTSYLPVGKYDPQGCGGGLTYLRRYSLSAIWGITQEDDDGETAMGRGGSGSKRTTPAPKKVDISGLESAKSLRELDDRANDLVDAGADEEEVARAHVRLEKQLLASAKKRLER